MTNSSVNIGLINPKNPDNVNAIMRSAGNYRVEQVYYTGKRYAQAIKHKPNAPDLKRKVGKAIPLTQVESLTNVTANKMKLVCIEFAENAISLPKFQHPNNAFYIFGSEDGTISQEIIDLAEAVVYIPTIGCMNLAATVNIVLYDRLAKSPENFDTLELIRSSRDNNNCLKVKN